MLNMFAVLHTRLDALQLKAELEDVARNQRQQLSIDDPELADWQLEQMPRTTALAKQGILCLPTRSKTICMLRMDLVGISD